MASPLASESSVAQGDVLIAGGATLWARKTVDSDIFHKPDKWFKMWFFIVNRANYADNGKYKRGQCHLTYDQIRIATGASKDQIKHGIAYLKGAHMLATQKATRGFIVTVLNYGVYQNIDSYKGRTKSPQDAQDTPQKGHTIQ